MAFLPILYWNAQTQLRLLVCEKLMSLFTLGNFTANEHRWDTHKTVCALETDHSQCQTDLAETPITYEALLRIWFSITQACSRAQAPRYEHN